RPTRGRARGCGWRARSPGTGSPPRRRPRTTATCVSCPHHRPGGLQVGEERRPLLVARALPARLVPEHLPHRPAPEVAVEDLHVVRGEQPGMDASTCVAEPFEVLA